MADWGPWSGDRVLVPNSHANITPSNTAHVKGAWVGSSDTGRGEGLLISVDWLQAHTTARTLLVDVGVGSPEQTIISNLMLCPPSVGGNSVVRSVAQSAYFPVLLPNDAVKLRAQASMGSHGGVYITTTRCKSGLPCVGSVVDTYGADTAGSKGTTITAPASDGIVGSWTQVASSCERIKALMIAIGHGQAAWTTFTDQYYAVQVGVGASGQEQALIVAQSAGASSSATGTVSQMVLGPFYVDVPAGERMSVRIGKQHASASQRTLDVVLYGIR